MSAMYQESISDLEFEKCFAREGCKVEHCFFPWTVKDVLFKAEKNTDSLGTLMFAASNDVESFTLWQIGLNCFGDKDDIQIDLRRLKSQNVSPVFVRFHWEILDAAGKMEFPGNIHSIVYADDKISKTFAKKRWLLKDKQRYLADGDLHVLCNMYVYERTLEEIISNRVKANVEENFMMLSGDMERLFLSESSADLHIRTLDGVLCSHRAVLSVRSEVFAELLKTKTDDFLLNLSSVKSDALHTLLMYLYSGRTDLYLKHTIPIDLFDEAKRYGLSDLQQHLNSVFSNNLTRLKSIDVTWKIPLFSNLILQPKTVLYCPDPTRTLYDNRWCFRLEFESSTDKVDISIIRKQSDFSVHFVKFIIRVETFGKISFEKSMFSMFSSDGEEVLEAFLTKDELSNLLSFQDTLVLKCSLEILYQMDHALEVSSTNSLSAVVELFTGHMESNLNQLSEDFYHLFTSEVFSDATAKTKIGDISFHSFLAEARYLTPVKDMKDFIENLEPMLVLSFFHFIYIGDILTNRASRLRLFAEKYDLRNVVATFSDFLSQHDDCYERKSDDNESD